MKEIVNELNILVYFESLARKNAKKVSLSLTLEHLLARGQATESSTCTHWSNTIPCAHMEPFSISISISLVLQVVQRRQKQSPEAEVQDPGSHTDPVEDLQALGPWKHPSCCGKQTGEQ